MVGMLLPLALCGLGGGSMADALPLFASRGGDGGGADGAPFPLPA